ncbi:unnamed protein product [Calypogeia fissa]
MALTGVKISEETYLTCLTHALSTETEEIMGLLLGDIEYSADGSAVALVWWAAPQTRSDRRKDRVETNPEQLAAASAQAEKMSAEIGRTTRVIGWYHSHPHITVMPSHVDVRTQGMYQMLDPGFVGLIFSCFSEDANKVGRIQVIAFQSQDGQRRDVPHFRGSGTNLAAIDATRPAPVTPVTCTNDAEIPGASAPGKVGSGSSAKQQSAALESLFAIQDSEAASTPGTSTAEDESLSMQEAMHLSTLEASGAEFIRKEIHLQIVPGHALVKLRFPLAPLVELQRILFEEEQAAFRHAIAQSTVNGRIHPLAVLHHEAQYQATLSKLMEYCLCPAISCLTDKVHQNKIRAVHEESQALQLEHISTSSKGSPKPPQLMRRISQRNLTPSSSIGRHQTDVFSPSARRSMGIGGSVRIVPENKPQSPPDLMRF